MNGRDSSFRQYRLNDQCARTWSQNRCNRDVEICQQIQMDHEPPSYPMLAEPAAEVKACRPAPRQFQHPVPRNYQRTLVNRLIQAA